METGDDHPDEIYDKHVESTVEVGEEPPVKRSKVDDIKDDGKAAEDMLSTIISDAFKQKLMIGEGTSESVKEEIPKKESESWCTVGTFDRAGSIIVKDYASTERTSGTDLEFNVNMSRVRTQLEPAAVYKFRICGVNGAGAGPWSEITTFKTATPGLPGSPRAVKISNSPEGPILRWEPPSGDNGEITGYAVYLAIRNASQVNQLLATKNAKLTFDLVYVGRDNRCLVANNRLQSAYIDTTTKPVMIFRIAVKNSKGFGPALQVRWVQGPDQAPQNGDAEDVLKG